MRRLIGLAVFVVLLLPAAALAQTTEEFSFDIPHLVIRDDTGTTHALETVNVPSNLVGASCTFEAVAGNNISVHPGNDLIMSSGGDSVTLPDVERAPGAVTPSNGSITLGDTIDVTLFLGTDNGNGRGVFSGGFTVNVSCTDEPEPEPSPSPSPSPEPSETESPRPPGEVESEGEVKSQQEVAAEDSGSLPFTGPQVVVPLLWATGLLGAGFSALWVSRRK
jgi:hypothetical protein